MRVKTDERFYMILKWISIRSEIKSRISGFVSRALWLGRLYNSYDRPLENRVKSHSVSRNVSLLVKVICLFLAILIRSLAHSTERFIRQLITVFFLQNKVFISKCYSDSNAFQSNLLMTDIRRNKRLLFYDRLISRGLYSSYGPFTLYSIVAVVLLVSCGLVAVFIPRFKRVIEQKGLGACFRLIFTKKWIVSPARLGNAEVSKLAQ